MGQIAPYLSLDKLPPQRDKVEPAHAVQDFYRIAATTLINSSRPAGFPNPAENL